MGETTVGSGPGGASGSGGEADPCVLTSLKSCQTVGCHGGSTVSANLNLDASTLVTDFRTLVRRNSGDYSYPAACRPGTFYLIDPTNPENSLIYQKLSDIPLCGMRMPQIGAALKPADKACVLSWINSVIAVR